MKLVEIKKYPTENEKGLVVLELTEKELKVEDKLNNDFLIAYKAYEENGDCSKLLKGKWFRDITLRDGTMFSYAGHVDVKRDDKNRILCTFEFSYLCKVIRAKDLEKHNPDMAYIHKCIGLCTEDKFESILDKCNYKVIDANENKIIVEEI